MFIKTSSIAALLSCVSIQTITTTQALPVTNTITNTNTNTNINHDKNLIHHRSKRADCTVKGRNPFTNAGFIECCEGLEKELGHDASTGSFHYICVVHENIDVPVEKDATLFLKGNIRLQNEDKNILDKNDDNKNKDKGPVIVSNDNGEEVLSTQDESQDDLDDDFDDFYDEEEDEDIDWGDEDDDSDDDDELGPEPGDDDYLDK